MARLDNETNSSQKKILYSRHSFIGFLICSIGVPRVRPRCLEEWIRGVFHFFFWCALLRVRVFLMLSKRYCIRMITCNANMYVFVNNFRYFSYFLSCSASVLSTKRQFTSNKMRYSLCYIGRICTSHHRLFNTSFCWNSWLIKASFQACAL